MFSLPRFDSKIKKSNGCWLWTGGVSGNGYGYFFLNKKYTQVHRVAYSLSKGNIPKGLFVCHSCDVKLCVNPKHLWLGTHKENMEDCASKGRTKNSNKTHCKCGEKLILRWGQKYCKPCHNERQRTYKREK